jgi:hypothetical protein
MVRDGAFWISGLSPPFRGDYDTTSSLVVFIGSSSMLQVALGEQFPKHKAVEKMKKQCFRTRVALFGQTSPFGSVRSLMGSAVVASPCSYGNRVSGIHFFHRWARVIWFHVDCVSLRTVFAAWLTIFPAISVTFP